MICLPTFTQTFHNHVCMSVINTIKEFAENTVRQMGYPGIALLMGLDSMCIPIPSEAIMPTGGLVAQSGKLNFWLVGLAGASGSFFGSLICYGIGSKLGKPFLEKYGKYVLMRQKELDHAQAWFDKYGSGVTLWGRFVPVIRTFISLPAGIYKMDFPRFALYALLGSVPWAFLWAWVGFQFGEHWEGLKSSLHIVDYVIGGLILLLIVRFLYHRFKKSEATS